MTRTSSLWTLYLVWSEDLEGLINGHKASNYQLLSKLCLGKKLFEATTFEEDVKQFQDFDFFTLVEVDEVLSINESDETRELVVRGNEPKVADNWFVSQQHLKINVKFQKELSDIIKDRLKPGDIIVVYQGRINYNSDEGVAQVETNTSLSSVPVYVIVFRPCSDGEENIDKAEDYVCHIRKFPRLQFEHHSNQKSDIIKINPKAVDLLKENVDICQGESLRNYTEGLAVNEVPRENDSDNESASSNNIREAGNGYDGSNSNSESDNDFHPNNNFVLDSNFSIIGRYKWKKMRKFKDERMDDDSHVTMSPSSVESEKSEEQNELREINMHWGDSELLANLESGDEDMEVKERTSADKTLNTQQNQIIELQDSSNSMSDNSDSDKKNQSLMSISDASPIELDSDVEVFISSPSPVKKNDKRIKNGEARMTRKSPVDKLLGDKQNSQIENNGSESSSPFSLVSVHPGEVVQTPDFINNTAVASILNRNGSRQSFSI